AIVTYNTHHFTFPDFKTNLSQRPKNTLVILNKRRKAPKSLQVYEWRSEQILKTVRNTITFMFLDTNSVSLANILNCNRRIHTSNYVSKKSFHHFKVQCTT